MLKVQVSSCVLVQSIINGFCYHFDLVNGRLSSQCQSLWKWPTDRAQLPMRCTQNVNSVGPRGLSEMLHFSHLADVNPKSIQGDSRQNDSGGVPCITVFVRL
jgi:hypothetical protein